MKINMTEKWEMKKWQCEMIERKVTDIDDNESIDSNEESPVKWYMKIILQWI